MTKLGKAATLIVFILVAALLRAIVLAHLWQWFVADVFGIRRISVAVAYGLLAIVMLVLPKPSAGDSDDERWVVRLVTSASYTLLVFLVGLLAVQFV